MSATNWAECPNCKSVDPDGSQKGDETLREDYECFVNDKCLLEIYFSCHCDRCGFGKSFNYIESKKKVE